MPGEKPKVETRKGKKFGSAAAYARHRRVSNPTVSTALKAGRITAGPDGMIDFEKADRDWALNTRPRSDGVDRGDESAAPDAQRYAKSRAAREEFAAKLVQLEYETKAGNLVPVSEVRAKWSEICVAIRTAVEGIPSKLAQNVHAARDVREVHDILAAECRAVLRQLSGDVQATAEEAE